MASSNFEVADRSRVIEETVNQQWQGLPLQLKLEGGSLRECAQEAPFTIDFLASVRLDYLHVRLLILQLKSSLSEPDTSIIPIAREMLTLVIQLMLRRDIAVNSGTSLVWKVGS